MRTESSVPAAAPDPLADPEAVPDATDVFPDAVPFDACDDPPPGAVDDPPPEGPPEVDPFPGGEPCEELCPQPAETAATESATSAVDHPSREEFIGRTYSERGVLAMCDGVRSWEGHPACESFIWNESRMRARQRDTSRAAVETTIGDDPRTKIPLDLNR
jgi:hypothetical protein